MPDLSPPTAATRLARHSKKQKMVLKCTLSMLLQQKLQIVLTRSREFFLVSRSRAASIVPNVKAKWTKHANCLAVQQSSSNLYLHQVQG